MHNWVENIKKKIYKSSLHEKYILIFCITVFIITASFLIIGANIYMFNLRREAITVANGVKAFRQWIANTDGIWVNELHPDFKTFLFKKKFEGKDNDVFYAKNPALATRELAEIYSSITKGTTFKITSDNLRRPENKPDRFELKAIKTFQQDKGLKYIGRFEGNAYRHSQPLIIVKACLKCHGNPEDAPKELIEKYGDNKAFGYKVDDVRGVISVTIPQVGLVSVIRIFDFPIALSILAIGGVLALNFIWFKRNISQPLNKLTMAAEEISKGDLTKKVEIDGDMADFKTKDEIQRLGTAFNKMTDALQKRNQELKDFAYITSHDLRSPLINLGGFSHRLEKSIKKMAAALKETLEKDGLNDSALKKKLENSYDLFIKDTELSLRYISYSVEKMDSLIGSILELSRINTEKDVFSEINLSIVIKKILAIFEFQIEEKGIKVMVKELPKIYGDEKKIEQVFSNLVNNAIKYNKGSSPFIEIGAVEVDNSYRFYIKDNGIGIDERYKDKIFVIFTQLKEVESSGDGIGLTLAKKIIERHGGTIWVDSKKGEGSIFWFELPKKGGIDDKGPFYEDTIGRG